MTSTAKRMSAKLSGREGDGRSAADPGAVEIQRRPDGTIDVTVRIVAATSPPIKDVAHDVATRIARELHPVAGGRTTVTVNVVDIET